MTHLRFFGSHNLSLLVKCRTVSMAVQTLNVGQKNKLGEQCVLWTGSRVAIADVGYYVFRDVVQLAFLLSKNAT